MTKSPMTRSKNQKSKESCTYQQLKCSQQQEEESRDDGDRSHLPDLPNRQTSASSPPRTDMPTKGSFKGCPQDYPQHQMPTHLTVMMSALFQSCSAIADRSSSPNFVHFMQAKENESILGRISLLVSEFQEEMAETSTLDIVRTLLCLMPNSILAKTDVEDMRREFWWTPDDSLIKEMSINMNDPRINGAQNFNLRLEMREKLFKTLFVELFLSLIKKLHQHSCNGRSFGCANETCDYNGLVNKHKIKDAEREVIQLVYLVSSIMLIATDDSEVNDQCNFWHRVFFSCMEMDVLRTDARTIFPFVRTRGLTGDLRIKFIEAFRNHAVCELNDSLQDDATPLPHMPKSRAKSYTRIPLSHINLSALSRITSCKCDFQRSPILSIKLTTAQARHVLRSCIVGQSHGARFFNTFVVSEEVIPTRLRSLPRFLSYDPSKDRSFNARVLFFRASLDMSLDPLPHRILQIFGTMHEVGMAAFLEAWSDVQSKIDDVRGASQFYKAYCRQMIQRGAYRRCQVVEKIRTELQYQYGPFIGELETLDIIAQNLKPPHIYNTGTETVLANLRDGDDNFFNNSLSHQSLNDVQGTFSSGSPFDPLDNNKCIEELQPFWGIFDIAANLLSLWQSVYPKQEPLTIVIPDLTILYAGLNINLTLAGVALQSCYHMCANHVGLILGLTRETVERLGTIALFVSRAFSCQDFSTHRQNEYRFFSNIPNDHFKSTFTPVVLGVTCL